MAYVITIAKNTAPVRTRLVGSHKFGISGRTATGTLGARDSGRLAGKAKKWGFPEPKLDGNPQHVNAAARYSPTPSRVQYHRRARP